MQHIIGSPLKRQTGVVMIVTLISLVLLLLASVALVRSTDTNLLIAGSMSFKRDVLNQAERAIPQIKTAFETGALALGSAREVDVKTANYFATIQASNASGIPKQLLDTVAFDGDFASNNIVDKTAQVTIRYLIDRMSLVTGPCDPTKCTLSASTSEVGGDAFNATAGGGGGAGSYSRAKGQDIPVYRITIRATGPRNAEAFVQYTFSI